MGENAALPPSFMHAVPGSRSTTSLVAPDFSLLSDPLQRQVDSNVLEYLSTEMLDTVAQGSKAAHRKHRQRRGLVELEYGMPPTAVDEEDEDEKGVSSRLDAIGFQTGSVLCESLLRDKPGFVRVRGSSRPEPLEIIKFICKEVWVCLYDKQIDNLRTNHRGIFVLQDKAFKPILRMSPSALNAARMLMARRAESLVCFPAGVVRGILARMSIPCVVGAELGNDGLGTGLPVFGEEQHCLRYKVPVTVTFQVKITPASTSAASGV